MISSPATATVREPWTVRVAMWSARRRWLVFGLWFVGTIGLFGLSLAAGGIRTLDVNEDPNERRLESEEAYEVFGAGEPVAPSERLVIVLDGGAGAAADPKFRAGVDSGEVRVLVSGQAAFALDVTQIYVDGTPRIFAFVLGLSFLLMLIAFRSIVIPIKAIALNLLSTGAAFGVLVLVFHDGWLAEPLGITAGGVIESWVPVFIFTILFGLSMDYHLFILTRIKEARDRGLDSRAAIARGIAVTSGTITSAASIMVVVFAAFVALKFVFIQQLGLGLAVAVFIDATIVRSVNLPATMQLLGDRNWWLPPFLRWLPRIKIEGERAEPEAGSEGRA